MGDIFDQAVQQPAAPPAGAADIFDQAAVPQKGFSQRVGERIGQNVNAPPHLLMGLADGIKDALAHPRQPGQQTSGSKIVYPWGEDSAAAKVAGVATVGPRAAYSVASDLFHQYRSDPANLVGDIITAHVFHGIGDEGATPADAQPKGATQKASTASGAPNVNLDRVTHATGVISPRFANAIEDVRAGNYGKALAHALPVDIPARVDRLQQLAKTFMEGPEPPKPSAPEAPNIYGTPREQWGQAIPEQATPAPKAAKIPARTVRQSQSLAPNAAVQNQAEALRAVPPAEASGDIFDRATQPETPPASNRSATPRSTPPIYPVKKVSEWGVADQNKQLIRAMSPARQGLGADFSSLGNYQPGQSVVAHTFGDVTDDAAVEDALRNDLAKMAARGEFQEQRSMREGSSADVSKGQRAEEFAAERSRRLRDLQEQPKALPPELTAPWALSRLQ